MIGWIVLGVALVLNATANILLKMGSSTVRGEPSFQLLQQAVLNPYLLGGVLLFALNILCYTFALSRLPLSLAYPAMVIGGLLIVTTLAVLVFGESLATIQAGGLALVVLGVILLYL